MSTIKITVTVTIDTEGSNCWQCPHGLPCNGPMCDLFGKRRTKAEDGGTWQRLPECVEAEKKSKETLC